MSTTLKISNGDLFIDESFGAPTTLSGVEKLSQDIAESLLINFDPERRFGNTLNSSSSRQSIIGQISKIDARERIEAAIDRLRRLQSEDDQIEDDEQIVEIVSIDIDVLENGTEIRFLLVVATVSKKEVSASGTIPLQAVKLDHVTPPDIFNINAQGNI